MEPAQYRRFVLMSSPRTASNLFVKMINATDQPNVEPPSNHGGYYFFPTIIKINELGLRQKPMDEWTEEERTAMLQCSQDCFNNFVKYTTEAEANGKIAFIKEHANLFFGPTDTVNLACPGRETKEDRWMVQIPGSDGKKSTRSPLNKSIMPDEYLKTLSPIILIRHPALSFPSFQRQIQQMPAPIVCSMDAERRIAMTYQFTASMHAYFADLHSPEKGGEATWPLVLEADDIITQPDVMAQLVERMGMDMSKVLFSWEEQSQEQIDRLPTPMRVFLGTLNASTGLKTDRLSANIDIDVEARKWREEFGEEIGKQVEGFVRDAMPDYEFLKAKRMMPRTSATS
ncbi:hypothetical protein BJ875DRAFT_459645 [Amylocarpus encephaloides]|uniref:Sulfotransferase domain-containing protein n=1 Tax=Amylocarpus encephaloides TaxID=45428 RepID=A0A9P7YKI4_9HELO|nr:hypothetical protein BJ875DRAFT_459645 [Amylocarpus encephaloides]